MVAVLEATERRHRALVNAELQRRTVRAEQVGALSGIRELIVRIGKFRTIRPAGLEVFLTERPCRGDRQRHRSRRNQRNGREPRMHRSKHHDPRSSALKPGSANYGRDRRNVNPVHANLRIGLKWSDDYRGRLGTAVRHSIPFNLFVLGLLSGSLALSGCAVAPRVQADDQAKAADNAQLIEQSKAAMAACDAKFPAGDATTAVVRRKCINDGFAIKLPIFGPDQDLVRGVMADSMVIAGQVQTGKMTIAGGNAAIAEKWSKAVTESQRRANSKNSVLARTKRGSRTTAACGGGGCGCGARGRRPCRPSRFYLHPKRRHDDVQLGRR